MLDPLPRKKLVIPNGIDQVIQEDFPDMKHISSMMCHSIGGEVMPPFIILSKLKKLPGELYEMCQLRQIYVSSSDNGYMTRDLFLIWALHFINFIAEYRQKLPPELKYKTILLIVDGHSSREAPLALWLLRNNNISVLVLPAHSSHVLQMFDVVLASPLKQQFTKIFSKLLKLYAHDETFETDTAKVRLASIKAIASAWKANSTPYLTELSGKKTGTFPVDVDEVKKSVYVRELIEEEAAAYQKRQERMANRLKISSKIITENSCLQEIINNIIKVQRFSYLCEFRKYAGKSYKDIVKDIISTPHNNCRLLSTMPPILVNQTTFD